MFLQITGWGKSDNYWVGLTDQKEENTFVWDSGKEFSIQEHWGQGEPNDHGDNEDCVHYKNGILNDLPCAPTQKAQVVCQKGRMHIDLEHFLGFQGLSKGN